MALASVLLKIQDLQMTCRVSDAVSLRHYLFYSFNSMGYQIVVGEWREWMSVYSDYKKKIGLKLQT